VTVKVSIIHDSPIRLWGLSSRERLERMFKKAGLPGIQEEPLSADEDTVLILRGDYLYDQRIIQNLLDKNSVVLEINTAEGPLPVAAHVSPELAERMRKLLSEGGPCDYPEGLQLETPDTLVTAYMKSLLKFEPPFLLRITEKNRRSLEKRLFDGSYKGVTDLVTKWLWPMPARWATRICARYGIVPNHVTSLSLVLSVFAGGLFYFGYYASGLVAAWFMTFLDTVDGKLARVTLNYSTFGNIFDHAIDLIFPPIWYLAWGMSLATLPGVSHAVAFWAVMAGYIAGRMIELIFSLGLESSGIFCWQPIDSCFRLITGRRNPNLVILTASLCFARPDLGFLTVCLWTVLSSLFLIARLGMGLYTRITSGPLRSWFLDIDPSNDSLSFYQRWFCRRPDAKSAYE
jgi:phosphatidylglycerophosphate synthase